MDWSHRSLFEAVKRCKDTEHTEGRDWDALPSFSVCSVPSVVGPGRAAPAGLGEVHLEVACYKQGTPTKSFRSARGFRIFPPVDRL